METPLFLTHPFKTPISDRENNPVPAQPGHSRRFSESFYIHPAKCLEETSLDTARRHIPKNIYSTLFHAAYRRTFPFSIGRCIRKFPILAIAIESVPPRCLLGMRPFYYFAVLHALLKLAYSRVSGISQRMKNEKSRPGGRPFP